jgi:hypothetical protein
MVSHNARRTDESECGSGSATVCGNASCLYKKQLDLFFRFANISLKRNLNAIKGILFAVICRILPEKENRWFSLRRKIDTVGRE